MAERGGRINPLFSGLAQELEQLVSGEELTHACDPPLTRLFWHVVAGGHAVMRNSGGECGPGSEILELADDLVTKGRSPGREYLLP